VQFIRPNALPVTLPNQNRVIPNQNRFIRAVMGKKSKKKSKTKAKVKAVPPGGSV
jgi:hypothetical protein